MSGRDEEVWSKEPPSEPGKYWLKWPCHEDTIGDFTGKHWWLVCGNYSVTSEQLIMSEWQFGPRIPSPSQLTAAAKRVEELEGDAKKYTEIKRLVMDNGQEFVSPEIWRMLERMKSYCCKSLLRECADKSQQILDLTTQLAALKAVGVNNEPLEERLGRRIRQVWMDWAKEQPDITQRPDWLDPWELLPERIKEVDRRLGCAIWGDCVNEFSEAIAFHALHNTTNGEGER